MMRGIAAKVFLRVVLCCVGSVLPVQAKEPGVLRFATFNASLHRTFAGQLANNLSTRDDAQAGKIAEIVQRVRPDVLLVNELDYDSSTARLFSENYLAWRQGLQIPIGYPYRYAAASNTGLPSDYDLDNDGETNGPGDAFGYGDFPGQYGMAVYSMYPLERRPHPVRTFRTFLWKDMPDASLPREPGSGQPYYSAEELQVVRLSSKSHWDLSVQVDDRIVHFLVCHPTPPVFDGDEDRNGLRNHDEIRFFADYIDPGRSAYIYDDEGATGGLSAGAAFVIAGDMNADPHDGDSISSAITQLIEHRLVRSTPIPSSAGGALAGQGNGHIGDPAQDTAAFNGNLRVDYVLPSRTLYVVDSGVFWPEPGEDGAELLDASDHRLVWVDVALEDPDKGTVLVVR